MLFFVFGDQIFSAEKVNYDFKNNQGSFIKVKGLIKPKILENLILLYDSDTVPTVVQTINR